MLSLVIITRVMSVSPRKKGLIKRTEQAHRPSVIESWRWALRCAGTPGQCKSWSPVILRASTDAQSCAFARLQLSVQHVMGDFALRISGADAGLDYVVYVQIGGSSGASRLSDNAGEVTVSLRESSVGDADTLPESLARFLRRKLQETETQYERKQAARGAVGRAESLLRSHLEQTAQRAVELYTARHPRWWLSTGPVAVATRIAAGEKHPILVPSESTVRRDVVVRGSGLAGTAARGDFGASPDRLEATGRSGFGPGSVRSAAKTGDASPSGLSLGSLSLTLAEASGPSVSAQVTRELLAGRTIRKGYHEYFRCADSFEQRKLRVALVAAAMDHPEWHTAASLAGNQFFQGPFYVDTRERSAAGSARPVTERPALDLSVTDDSAASDK